MLFSNCGDCLIKEKKNGLDCLQEFFSNTERIDRFRVTCFVLNFHRQPKSLAGKKYRATAMSKTKII